MSHYYTLSPEIDYSNKNTNKRNKGQVDAKILRKLRENCFLFVLLVNYLCVPKKNRCVVQKNAPYFRRGLREGLQPSGRAAAALQCQVTQLPSVTLCVRVLR